MDMSVSEDGSLWRRVTSARGLTAISHYFVMEWASVWLDIVGGLLIAGALAAWVPREFWQSFFLIGHPILSNLWGPLVGPLVAVVSFVCSVGNIPARRDTVERRHQLRRGHRLYFRRPHRPAGDQHLSKILRAEDGRLPVCHILRRHGHGGADRRVDLRRRWGSFRRSTSARVVEASISFNYTTLLNIVVPRACRIARLALPAEPAARRCSG